MYFLEHVESSPDVVYSARDAVRCRNWHPDAGGRGCRRCGTMHASATLLFVWYTALDKALPSP